MIIVSVPTDRAAILQQWARETPDDMGMLAALAQGRLSHAYDLAYKTLEDHNLHAVNLVLKALHDELDKIQDNGR